MSSCATNPRIQIGIRARQVRPTERGVALLAVLTFVVLLGSLGATLVVVGRTHSDTIQREARAIRALEAADAAIVHAGFELSRGVDLDGDALIGDVAGTVDGAAFTVTSAPLDRRQVRLIAAGEFEGIRRQIEVVVEPTPTTAFRRALAGTQSVVMSGGAETDSYDSSLGPYILQASHWDEIGRYANAFGSVASNATLSLSGSSTRVRGAAHPGPGETLTGDGFPTITGSTAPLSQAMPLDPPPESDFLAALSDNDNDSLPTGTGVTYDPVSQTLSLASGAIAALSPGTYVLRGLSITGYAHLVVTGPTTIYLAGDLAIESGGLLNLTFQPGQLSLIAHPYDLVEGEDPNPPETPLQITLAGSTHTAWTVYAPAADISVSGGVEIYGAMVGGAIEVAGGRLHYDESLAFDPDLAFQPYHRLAWRDLTPIPGLPPASGDPESQ